MYENKQKGTTIPRHTVTSHKRKKTTSCIVFNTEFKRRHECLLLKEDMNDLELVITVLRVWGILLVRWVVETDGVFTNICCSHWQVKKI